MYRYFVILLAVLFISCSSQHKNISSPKKADYLTLPKIPLSFLKLKNLAAYSVESRPLEKIHLTKDRSFGSTRNIFFKYIGQIAVDSLNRVYISDKHNIKVFNPSGKVVAVLGREGRGPGEFDNFGHLLIKIKHSRLYAYDDVLRRINVFNLDSLKYSYTIPLNPHNWSQVSKLKQSGFGAFFIDKDQTLLVAFKDGAGLKNKKRYNRYYKMNKQGDLISGQLFKTKVVNFNNKGFGLRAPPAPINPLPPVFASTRSIFIQTDHTEHIYKVNSQFFLIKIYDETGHYQRAIYYPFKNLPLDKKKLIASYHSHALKKEAQKAQLPDSWPAINYFLVDNRNRIWICTISDDEQKFTWWVLKNNGQLMAKFKWPGERMKRDRSPQHIKVIKNGFLYALQKNESSGLNSIERYKIIFSGLDK